MHARRSAPARILSLLAPAPSRAARGGGRLVLPRLANLWYWFDDDGDFRVDSGVLTKQQRRLQLSRLQSVDVAQPLVARVFSMAEVSVEVAGTQDSRVKLQFLAAGGRAVAAQRAARAGRRASARRRRGSRGADRDGRAAGSRAVAASCEPSRQVLLLLTAVIVAGTVWSSGWGGLGIAVITGGLPILWS